MYQNDENSQLLGSNLSHGKAGDSHDSYRRESWFIFI